MKANEEKYGLPIRMGQLKEEKTRCLISSMRANCAREIKPKLKSAAMFLLPAFWPAVRSAKIAGHNARSKAAHSDPSFTR